MSRVSIVIPVQAGIHTPSLGDRAATFANMDTRLRGDDEVVL